MRNKIILLILLAIAIVIVGYFLLAKHKTQNSNLVEVNNHEIPQNNDKGLPALPKNMAKPIIDNTIRPDQGQLIAKQIAAFEEAFYSQDTEQLYSQAEIIKKLGKDCIPQLLNIIANKEHDLVLRKMVFELIRDIGPSAAEADLFIEIMIDESDDAFIRKEAAWTLGKTGSDQAVNPLMEMVQNKNQNVQIRDMAALSLGWIGDIRAEDLLILTALDKNESPQVRSASINALGHIKTSKALNALIYSLNDKSWGIQSASANALSGFTDDKDKVVRALNDKLINSIGEENSDVQDVVVESIISSLSELKSHESVPVLLEVLRGENKYYSAHAGEALGKIGDKRALVPIEEALKNAVDPLEIRLLTEAQKKLIEKSF